jgi:hypothetical protein
MANGNFLSVQEIAPLRPLVQHEFITSATAFCVHGLASGAVKTILPMSFSIKENPADRSETMYVIYFLILTMVNSRVSVMFARRLKECINFNILMTVVVDPLIER